MIVDCIFVELSHGQPTVGRTALHLAAKRNQHKLIPVLIEFHAELDITDSGGNSAMMMAAAEGTMLDFVLFMSHKSIKYEKNKSDKIEHEKRPLSMRTIVGRGRRASKCQK